MEHFGKLVLPIALLIHAHLRSTLIALLTVLALGASACGASKPDPAASEIAFVTSRDGDYAIYGMRETAQPRCG